MKLVADWMSGLPANVRCLVADDKYVRSIDGWIDILQFLFTQSVEYNNRLTKINMVIHIKSCMHIMTTKEKSLAYT